MLGRHMVLYVRRYTLWGLRGPRLVSLAALAAAWPLLLAALWGHVLAGWLRGGTPQPGGCGGLVSADAGQLTGRCGTWRRAGGGEQRWRAGTSTRMRCCGCTTIWS